MRHSAPAESFFSRFDTLCEKALHTIGFGFLSVKQATFFFVISLILSSSFSFNLGTSHQVVYAFDAIDSEEVTDSNGEEVVVPEVLGTPDQYSLSVPVLPILGDENKTIQDYTVQSGDTIQSIAEKFLISPNTVALNNGIEDGVLKDGQVLKILPTTGTLYQVQNGDSVDGILNKYKDTGISKKVLMRFNASLESGLVANTYIIIPGVDPQPVIKEVAPTLEKKRNPKYVDARSGVYESLKTKKKITGNGRLLKPVSATQTQGYHRGHPGLDLANKIGTPVYASESGTVIRAQIGGWNGGYGNMIIIDHGDGLKTLYAHLSKIHVSVGEKVSRGEQIATMGNTGRSTGPHLHWEVHQGKAKVNPYSYL